MSAREKWPARTTDTAVIRDERTVVQGPAPVPPVEPDRSIGLGMLVALALVALAIAVAAVAWLLTHRSSSPSATTIISSTAQAPGSSGAAAGQRIAVPQLVGLSEQDALTQLTSAGLTPKLVRRTTGPVDDLVVTQRPAPSQKIARGSEVMILVDRSQLAAPGSKTKQKVVPTTPATTGATTVAATSPPPPQSTVPDLSGKSEVQAVDALDQAGLLPSIVFVPGQDPLGTVEAQSQSAGATLPSSSHVQINLSQGPNASVRETIPNVVGQTLAGAVGALNGSHLRLIYIKRPVTTRADVGKVIQQTPLSGGQAPQNAQILVFLGVLKSATHP
jgi:beta-lactam-binding protein with PASTA domain